MGEVPGQEQQQQDKQHTQQPTISDTRCKPPAAQSPVLATSQEAAPRRMDAWPNRAGAMAPGSEGSCVPGFVMSVQAAMVSLARFRERKGALAQSGRLVGQFGQEFCDFSWRR